MRAFRDLSKPMVSFSISFYSHSLCTLQGALDARRAAKIRNGYDDSAHADINFSNLPKYHYATHYSSSATVISYLLRLQPFTQYHVELQSGKFDDPARLFRSIKQSW